MVHPNISLLFKDDSQSKSLFAWICKQISQTNELEEFIKLHLETIKKVIHEIRDSQEVDFSDNYEAKKWAEEFLEKYEKKIREMRNVSNKVFEKFQILKKRDFQRIISENPEYQKPMKEMMEIFLNNNGLLIGKIIFSYRELWFVANRILYPDFKIGSISEYQKWIQDNLPNLTLLEKSLEKIYEEISLKKE